MRVVFRHTPSAPPELSIVLVDWSVRESFHALEYLARQDVDRARYEILWIEYYDTEPQALREALANSTVHGGLPAVDVWIVLGMPRDAYYHKHLLYNVGLLASRGEIVTFCDSDAMFSPRFVRSILEAFSRERDLVLHMDEVRSRSRHFYPFSHPGMEEFLASDLINWSGSRPDGVPRSDAVPIADRLHRANYGACMSARREDVIAIGGADEHLDFLGHVCGPYEMTFRLTNLGRKERWHESEWLHHTWHPGSSGEDNYVGPHDGRHLSLTALRARETGRILPLVENPGVRALREAAVRPFVFAPPLAMAGADGLASVWSSRALRLHEKRSGRRLSQMLRRPGLVAGAAARVVTGFGGYTGLILRATGVSNEPRPGVASAATGSSGWQSALAKGRKLVERWRLPGALLGDIYRAERLWLARAWQRLEGLRTEGVEEIQVYGPPSFAGLVRECAIALDLRVTRVVVDRGEDALPDVVTDGPPVVLAARFGLAVRRARLLARGVDAARIVLLDPAWLEAEFPWLPPRMPPPRDDLALSICLPTRGRPALARRLLERIHETAASPKHLEVVLFVDADDRASQDLDHPGLEVQRIVGPRISMGAITECMLRVSRGRRLLLLNDDVHIATPGWDAKLIAAVDGFTDGVVLVHGNDLHQRHLNATFPVIPRAIVEELDGVASVLYQHFHIESHLHDIFLRLRRLGHDRIVFLEDVVFEHFHPEDGPSKVMAGHKERADEDRVTFGALAEEREIAARRLGARIARGGGPIPWRREPPMPRRSERPLEVVRTRGDAARPELSLVLVTSHAAPDFSGEAASLQPGCSHEALVVRGSAGLALLATQAMKETRGRAVVFLRPGSTAEPGFGERALALLGCDVAAVHGAWADDRNGLLMRTGLLLVRGPRGLSLLEPGRGLPLNRLGDSPLPVADAASLFGLVVTREAFERVGGLRTGLVSDLGLGLDLCLRLAGAGLQVVQAKNLLWHLAGETEGMDPDDMATIFAEHGHRAYDLRTMLPGYSVAESPEGLFLLEPPPPGHG